MRVEFNFSLNANLKVIRQSKRSKCSHPVEGKEGKEHFFKRVGKVIVHALIGEAVKLILRLLAGF